MKTGNLYLTLGLVFSFAVHGVVFYFLMMTQAMTEPVKQSPSTLFVPVNVKVEVTQKPPPPPPPPEKPPVTRPSKPSHKIAGHPVPLPAKAKPSPPMSHKRTLKKQADTVETVKPVFGVSHQTVAADKNAGMAMRVGNTLQKEQEAGYVPPDQVKDYETVPLFELTTLPEFRKRVAPVYPESLRQSEREGEAALSVVIDASGKVMRVMVLRSDHRLFAEAAVAAVKKSLFTPATRNGVSVATVLDDLVYVFLLDE